MACSQTTVLLAAGEYAVAATIRPSGDKARSLAANGTRAWKYIGVGRGFREFHHHPPAANSSTRATAASPHAIRLVAAAWGADLVCVPLSAIHFNSLAKSLADC